MGIYLFRNGQQEGPFDLDTIRQGLTDGTFHPKDPAMTEENPDWSPLHTVLSLDDLPPPSTSNHLESTEQAAPGPTEQPGESSRPIDPAVAAFIDDEQDPKVMAKIVATAGDMLTPGEEIVYIAIQKKPLVNIMPEALLLTNKRYMIVRPKLMGMEFEDHLWTEVVNVHISEQFLNATVTCTIIENKKKRDFRVDSIPKVQARRVYARAQAFEELVREEQRTGSSPAARSVPTPARPVSPAQPSTLIPAPGHPTEDPLDTLTKLKKMLDAGLIKPAEYDAKKAEVLARM